MVTKKAAKKRQQNKVPAPEAKPAEKHWFPEDAKTATAATTPAKKTSPWQRRAAPINYGTLARPGINFKEIFNQHVDEKHKKLSDSQRDQLWKVVGSKMLSEPLSKLKEITDAEVKAQSVSR